MIKVDTVIQELSRLFLCIKFRWCSNHKR